jgi:glycosyltransferase involved in cell wall biosynthesis
LRARHAPARKLRDFPNAVDTRRFSPTTTEERRAARASFGLPAGARVVLHFGWSWELKGGELMLGAAEILRDEPDLIILSVIGERTVPVRGLEENPLIRALAPQADVKRLFDAADVFLSCSPAEGMPLAVLEALACGLAVVGTDIPVQKRLLDGLPGATAVPSAPAAIAAGIRRMLHLSEAERGQHVQIVRERLASSFDLDVWARRLVDIYEAALNSTRVK